MHMKKIVLALSALAIIVACNKNNAEDEHRYSISNEVEIVDGHEYVDQTDDFLKEMGELEAFLNSMSSESEKDAADKVNALTQKYSNQYRKGSIIIKKLEGTKETVIVQAKVTPKEEMYVYYNRTEGTDGAAFNDALRDFVMKADSQPLLEKSEMIQKVEEELISKFDPDKLSGSLTLSKTRDGYMSSWLVKEWPFNQK